MQSKTVTLTRPIFVKGKGLPKDGACLANQGDTITINSNNGAEWYTSLMYRGRSIQVATIPSSL